MSLLVETVVIVAPVFLVIFLGTLLARLKLLDQTFVYQANRLVYNVFLPILLFYKISSADFNTYFNGQLVIGSSLVIVFGFILSSFYVRLKKYPPAIQGSFSQGSFRGNLAYIGLAICLNTYGEDGLTRAGILMGFLVPVLNLFAIISLLMPHKANPTDRGPGWLEQLALNPLILASFSGIVWSYLKLPIPTIIDRSLSITAGLTLPLALLAIGGSFSLTRLKGDLKLAGLASGIKLFLLPLFAYILLVFFGVSGSNLGIGILMAGTPAATATYIMAHQMRGDAELAGSIVMVSTLTSALSYTIILLVLKTTGLL